MNQIKTNVISTTIIAIGIIGAITTAVLLIGHVPSTTNYIHKTVAEQSPYIKCVDTQAIHDYKMDCATLNALLQPAR